MTALVPNYAASWEFVQRFHTGRLVVLTGVSLDKKSIPTATFAPNEKKKFIAWCESCGKSNINLYFSVGEPMQAATKKLERTDIKAVHWLHVDLDPRAGEDIAQERARILGLLRESKGLPLPTCIVYSGGGYQAYWKLDAALPVDGLMEAAEDLKLYNLQIERQLGADNCHDVSRIMRLPGTINWPDAKKQKKGRTPQLAEVVEWHEDRVYPISAFTKAVIVQPQAGVATGAGIGAAPKIKAPDNIKRLGSIDDLGDAISDKTKIVIVQGCDPDDPLKFPSRSETLFFVVCELIRGKVDDDTVYSIITDPDFRISDSVREKGAGMERYALRQIERCKEQAEHPILREFNDKHAVIENFGGKCVVIEEVLDDRLKRFRLTKQGFLHFQNRYMNRMIVVGQKQNKSGETQNQEMPAGKWWLQHPKRRQYSKIVFAPGQDIAGAYNLWRGFGCEARPGDCGLFLAHVRDIVCGGVEEYYEYFLTWMANCVQNPGEQGHAAVVMRGKQGCGKSIVPNLFGQLFGRHYIMVNNSKHLVGQFNAHLRDCVVLFADEAFFAGDKQNESVLKTIVTEPMLTFELKGVDAEPSANCVHLMMASNEQWVIPAGYDDRRYFMLDVKPDKVGDRAYFDALVQQFENGGGREALLHMLLNYEMKINVRDVPKTDALRQQKSLSMNFNAEWWLSILQRGTVLIDQDEWVDFVAIDLLLHEYTNYMRAYNVSHRGNATRMGLAMKEFVPNLQRFQRSSPVQLPMPDGTTKTIGRPWCYKMPPLDACRKHFDENYGGPYKWEGDLEPQTLPDYGDVLG